MKHSIFVFLGEFQIFLRTPGNELDLEESFCNSEMSFGNEHDLDVSSCSSEMSIKETMDEDLDQDLFIHSIYKIHPEGPILMTTERYVL